MPRVARTIVLSILAGACTVQPLAAAAPATPLEKLTQSKAYEATIFRLFSLLPPDVFQRCPALVSKGSQVTVIKPPSFAPDGMPVSGAWKQSFPVSGCGNDTTVNLYFTAAADKKIESMVGIPGETHADPLLQRDAARDLLGAIHTKLPDCANPHVRNSHFDGRVIDGKLVADGAARTAGGLPTPWRETWIVSACQQTYTVPLTFTPGAGGTQIAAAGGSVTTP